MTTSRPAFVRLAVAIAMAIALSACGPPPTTPPPDDGTRCPSGSMYGCDKPDLGSTPDLVTPPDLDPPADMAIIANAMDCSGLKPSYTCATAGGYVNCVQVKMDQGACFINCDNTTVWRISPPSNPQTAPDRRFWLDSVGHFKAGGEINDCLP